MRTCRRALTVLALSLPLAAWAEVPVVDNNAGYGSSYPPAGYGTAGTSVAARAAAPGAAPGRRVNPVAPNQK
jgi:hypothetical protein